MAVKIQFRRDTATNWSNENPVLSQGEMALDITNNRFKLGDGSTAWNSLPYAVDFQPDGTYSQLRAQATTAEDVGLQNVTNESKSTMFTNPTFTGTVSGVTATMVGLENVTNESKSTMFTNPTFTGTVTGVTKGHVGLSNVDNVQQIPLSQKGQAEGVVPLNGATKIDSTYLPSFVDDVLEFADLDAFPATGETGKIYVTLDTNKTYRWTGSAYVEISASLVPNNGQLTVQGTTGLTGSGTFTADQSSNATITITPVVASESEAQTGTEAEKLMTPQRTKQAIDNQKPKKPFSVTNDASGAYIINSESNPDIILLRGFTYEFNINASGHPFWIQTETVPYNSSNNYNDGVTNNGEENGVITFNVPFDAPDTLYYMCQFHTSMNGEIIVKDAELESGLANVEYYTTTISTGDWSGTNPTTAVKTVSGVLSTDKPLIDIDLSSVAFANVEAKQTEYAKIYRVAATDADEITFYALEAPTEELVIQIKVVK